ncbi:Uncharacterised protein at_DN1747 [Pycnogonum litorale]
MVAMLTKVYLLFGKRKNAFDGINEKYFFGNLRPSPLANRWATTVVDANLISLIAEMSRFLRNERNFCIVYQSVVTMATEYLNGNISVFEHILNEGRNVASLACSSVNNSQQGARVI